MAGRSEQMASAASGDSASGREGSRRLLPFLLLPTLLILVTDFTCRRAQLASFPATEVFKYAASTAESALLWGSLLTLAILGSRTTRAIAVATILLVLSLSLGCQRYFHQQFGTYLNLDAVLFGSSFSGSVWHQVRAQLGSVGRALVVPFAATLVVILLATAFSRPRLRAVKIAKWAVYPAILGSLFLPCSDRALQAAPPDVIFLHALGGLLEVKAGLLHRPQLLPGERTPEFVPAMKAKPAAPRNIVFVLTESVRADVVCSAYDEKCVTSPATNRAVPSRIPLLSMRANDSTTAVSVAVLLAGVPSNSNREEMHSAPMLWELARSAGYDTAYFTSQDLRFGNSDLFVRDIGAKHRVVGADLDPEADLELGAEDTKLTAYAKRELPELREPFVAVVHYANTHFPYWVNDKNAPFSPSEFTKDPEKNDAFFNYYRNSIYLQDQTIGDFVSSLRESEVGPRTVIVFTSDHGEAFREHSQVGHTLSIYDEEIHVPAWIDAPPGTLTDEERAALVAKRDTPVFHADMLPTMLDLIGIWDAPELVRFRARYVGDSLLRTSPHRPIVPITNCAAVWGCPFRNWGVMQGTKKLEAREWDGDWHCFDVAADPGERKDLGVAACGPLSARAIAVFGGLPRDGRDLLSRDDTRDSDSAARWLRDDHFHRDDPARE